jgi:hypothetical protein
MPNEVAFTVTTTVEPTGEMTSLGLVQASPYERIRVLADCRSASASPAEIVISFVEGEGAPGWLDRYVLSAGAVVTRVYEVPGVILAVSAQPTADAPADIDVWVWGYRRPGE